MTVEPIRSDPAESTVPTDGSTRRCWRCLQQFPLDPDLPVGTVVRAAEWWVCDSCRVSLFGRRRAS